MDHSSQPHALSDSAAVQEWTTKTVYIGTAEQVVAAGIVQLHQLPGQPGRPEAVVYYHEGEQVEPVGRLDYQPDPEEWIRVDRTNEQYRVHVGLPRARALERRAKEKEATERRWAALNAERDEEQRARLVHELQKKAAGAKSDLDAMPTSRRAYLTKLAEKCRASLRNTCRHDMNLRRYGLCEHGYRLTDASVEAIAEAFDEVCDAIMEAEVLFDMMLHKTVRGKHLADIDEGFQEQLAQLVKPNPRILQGSAS
jgi:hypothetical protein